MVSLDVISLFTNILLEIEYRQCHKKMELHKIFYKNT